jgi:shikimate 5-dehydrogenase/shikimate kinase
MTQGKRLRSSRPGEARNSISSVEATKHFTGDASIVLAGIRGSGKSTLAIIASTAMKRRIVDAEKMFQQATGFTSSQYKKLHGADECHGRQADTIAHILAQNPKDAIIVCSWVERRAQRLLRDFCLSNPVIHIVRDAKAIRDHLRLEDEAKARSLLAVSSTIFRTCSNFEFFNLSETTSWTGDNIVNRTSPAPYLTLKRAERHFLRFLSLLMPPGSIPFIESAFPLASTPTERRSFTYAVSVKLSALVNDQGDDAGVDIEDLETGADVIELVVDDLCCLSATEFSESKGQLDTNRATGISRAFGLIRRSTVLPIMYHVVAPPNMHVLGSAAQRCYAEWVCHGMRLSPEYFTLDLDLDDIQLSRLLAAKGTSRVVAHRSRVIPITSEDESQSPPPAWSDPIWLHYYRRSQTLRFDLVRFTRPALNIDDNFEVQRLRLAISALNGPKLPLIAFSTGTLGRQSACFNPVLTSVASEGELSKHSKGPSQIANEGQILEQPVISAFQASKALYASFIYEPMELYVFGANVGYSLSPAMHNAACRACGIPHQYRPFSTDSMAEIQAMAMSPRFAGASVGLPFKVEAMSIAHALSAHARAVGAINTLIPIRQRLLGRDGTTTPEEGGVVDHEWLFAGANRAGPVRALYGENTDWVGIRACIRRGLSPANAVRPSSSGLVIGAGGMARAAVYAMLQLGVSNIAVINRSRQNAEKMVAHFQQVLSTQLPLLSAPAQTTPMAGAEDSIGGQPSASTGNSFSAQFHIFDSVADAWPESFRLPTMVVSCIPVHTIGSTPAPNFTLPSSWLDSPTGGVLVELGYKVLDTPFLEQGRARSALGWVTMDGLDLLPEQGFAQFELFTGRRAPRRLMRREVFRAYPKTPDNHAGEQLEQLEPRLRNVVEQEP